MLDHHPDLAVSNEAHFIYGGLGDPHPSGDPPLDAAMVERVSAHPAFARMQLDEADVREAGAQASTYGEFISALYTIYARKHDKPLAGEKAGHYIRYLPLLHSLFPWANAIHIIRDGRDVALSMLAWALEDRGPGRRFRLWDEAPVSVCALWWRWNILTGRRDRVELSADRYYEVRYEDLVASPERTLQHLSDFLALPFASEMLAYHVGKTRTEPGLSSKAAWLPPTPGLRDWRTELAPRDVALFEALAGDLLSLLGYERAFDGIPDEIQELARRCRASWEAEMRARTGRIASRIDLSLDLERLAEVR
jgi:hypothetical protein